MDNRILTIFTPLERLDILSLGERVFFDYIGKHSEEYSIKILVDLGVIETSEYHITGDNRILKNESISGSSPVYKDLSLMPFTLESYYEVLAERMQYVLPTIGLACVRHSIEDGFLTITYTISTQSQDEYRQILHDRILQQFEYKTYEGFDIVKKRVLEFIGKQSKLLDIDTLVIGKENITIAFDDLPKPKPIISPKDDIMLCDIFLSEDPLELILHDMILDRYILSIEEYRGRYKIQINKDNCLQGMSIRRPIRFDKITGRVHLHDEYIGTLAPGLKGYNIFAYLYNNPNTPLSAETIIRECGLPKEREKLPSEYISGSIHDGIITKLSPDSIKPYITRKAKMFTFMNINNEISE